MAKFKNMAKVDTELVKIILQRAELDGLIQSVKDTIEAQERNQPMSNEKKFEAFKRRAAAENEAKARTVVQQDKALNAAWFVFGTKKELKDQHILSNTGLFRKGEVMQDAKMNKDYFTQIDIRTTKEIKLYSKAADLLTTHPAGSYALEKDNKGLLTLKITNPANFWSVSRYLVIQVK